MKKNEQTIRDLWDINKNTNTHIIRVLTKEERDYLKKSWPEILQTG